MTDTPWCCVAPLPHLRKKWRSAEAAEVYGHFRSGMDTNDIARHYGIHESEIVRALDAHRGFVRGLVKAHMRQVAG